MTLTEKTFTERLAVLKPDNIRIDLLLAEKRTETDSYEGGCDLDSGKTKEIEVLKPTFTSVLEMVRYYVNDNTIPPDHIGTIDPNIYQDKKGSGTVTVEDRTAEGHFRCTYDRAENSRGKPPTEKENEEFKAGKINLKLATYEFYFYIRIVGVAEADLATLLAVNNW